MFFFSCQKDEIEISEKTEKLEINTLVKNGRLVFSSKQDFQNTLSNLSNRDQQQISSFSINQAYTESFNPLVPQISEENFYQEIDEYKIKLYNLQKKGDSSTQKNASTEELLEHFDDLEDVFGEDVFASFLNQDAEIQVADTIYSYTDHGLFFSHEDDYFKLANYRTANTIYTLSIANSDLIETKSPCDIAMKTNNYGGTKIVTDGVRHYNPIVIDIGCTSGGNTGGGNTGGNGNTGNDTGDNTGNNNSTTTFEALSNIAETLPVCEISEPWLGNLFGTVKVCIDQYESKRRVKTKYYDVDLGLAFAVGVKTKHQYKGWTGIWRKENTSEVALDLNSITWRFTHSTPPASNLFYNEPSRLYYGGKTFVKQSNFWNEVFNDEIPVIQLPFSESVDFIVHEIINADSPFNFLETELEVREAFYQTIWDGVESQLSSAGRQAGTGAVVFTGPTQTFFQVYDFTNSCSNCDKEEKLLDWGIATPQITVTFGSSNIGFTDLSYDFGNPDAVGISCFGMAKRNGDWHGNKLVFTEN